MWPALKAVSQASYIPSTKHALTAGLPEGNLRGALDVLSESQSANASVLTAQGLETTRDRQGGASRLTGCINTWQGGRGLRNRVRRPETDCVDLQTL
jgi:hypothetical protein